MLVEHLYGTPHQPPLLLLHPGGTLHNVWQPFIRQWSPSVYILAPDLLIDQTAPVPLSALAQEVLQWSQRLGLTEFDVIGSSLGANVALHMAIQDSARIRHLVLDSAQPGTETPPMPLIALTKILRGIFSVTPESLIMRGLISQFKTYSAADQHLIRADLMRLGKYGFIESIEAHLTHHVGDRLNRITALTLILEGSQDMLTRQGVGETLQRGIAQARRETIQNAGHATFLSQPKMFRHHVETFLSQSR